MSAENQRYAMDRFKAHWVNWLFLHVVSPSCRRLVPILVVSPAVQRFFLRAAGVISAALRRPTKPWIPPQIRPLALIWRFDDVAEVLGSHDRFTVSSFNEKMTECSHRFLLGMGFTDEYKRDIALLRSVMRPEDRDAIRKLAADASDDGVKRARDGRLNVVQDVVSPVVLEFVAKYMGVSELPEAATPGRTGISPLLHLFLDTASYMFNLDILTGNPESRKAAVDAGKRIKDHVDAAIAAKRGAPPMQRGDTILDRLLATEGVPDELVQRIVGGTSSGGIAVTFSQCLWVIDRLLDLPPTAFAAVQDAAVRGDEASLDRFVREASRFKPFPPGLLRRCDSEQTVAQHTRRARRLEAGTVVAALTWSAAFDPAQVKNPLQFHVGRDDSEYLLFGTGQHHCVAAQPERPIAQTLMTQMVRAVFAKRGLRRAPGKDGFIQGDKSSGGWPDTFFVEFDSPAAH